MKHRHLLFALALLPIDSTYASASQVSLAMAQARSAMAAFAAGQPELGGQHVLAARSHTDVALRSQVGQTKAKLKESLSQLKNASIQAEKGKPQTALVATGKALKSLEEIE